MFADLLFTLTGAVRSATRPLRARLLRAGAGACIGLGVLIGAALPAHAQRTVTTTGAGGGGFSITAVDRLHACTGIDMYSDACTGAFQSGEDAALVDSIVAQYQTTNPGSQWGTATRETSLGGADNGLFGYSGGLTGDIRFQRGFRGSFVVALSGLWASTAIGGGGFLRTPWSAYYLFDDVFAQSFTAVGGPFTLKWSLSDGLGPLDSTGRPTLLGARGLSVDRVSLYIYSANASSVPEPGSVALAILALGAAWGGTRWARIRRGHRRGRNPA